jgi:hypothetical protein
LINTWNPFRALEQEMIANPATMRTALPYTPPELGHSVTRYVRAFFPSELRLALSRGGVRTDAVYAGGSDWAARQPLTSQTADYILVGTKVEGRRA